MGPGMPPRSVVGRSAIPARSTTTARRGCSAPAVPPDGYPNTLDAWVGLILPRWNFGASLLNGNVSGASVDATGNSTGFFYGVANTADAQADQINARLFGGAMPQADHDRIRNYMLPN